MLDLFDRHTNAAGNFTRRKFLSVGSLCLGGLTLADLLRLRAEGSVANNRRQKAVIMVYLPGGASHIDMYDMKPDAPIEYRGEFRPIGTNVSGMQVCELMPCQARIADKFSIVRGIKTQGNHDPTELLTGIPAAASGQIGTLRRPAIGCVVSKIRGADGPIPPYVSVSSHKLLQSYDDPEEPAYLGPTNRPISLDGELRQDLDLRAAFRSRFDDRRRLLGELDRMRQNPEMTTYTERALEMLTSTRIRDALDLSRESDAIRRSYGEGIDPRAQGLDFLRVPARRGGRVACFGCRSLLGQYRRRDKRSRRLGYARLQFQAPAGKAADLRFGGRHAHLRPARPRNVGRRGRGGVERIRANAAHRRFDARWPRPLAECKFAP